MRQKILTFLTDTWIIKYCIISLHIKMNNWPKSMLLKMLLGTLIMQRCLAVPDYTDTILQDQETQILSDFDISSYTPGQFIRVEFKITGGNVLTTASLMARTSSPFTSNSIQIEDFYHEKPRQFSIADLDAMWEARRQQYINIRKETGENDLHLMVINYDPSYRNSDIDYEITITPGASRTCAPCENDGDDTQSCFCECEDDFEGKTCQRYIIGVDKNTTEYLQAYQLTFFQLPQTDSITIQMSVERGFAEVYVQFKRFDGEVASFYNVASGSSDGRYLLSGNQIKIDASPGGKKTLITAVSFYSHGTDFKITYYDTSGVSVLVIVMSVLGGLIFIGLVIAAICIIKRNRSANARVQSQNALPSNSTKLSAQEIQRYFPPVILQSVKNNNDGAAQPSLNQFNKQNQEGNQQDCVICLENIKDEELIRMGYCRHIFHSNCLVGWFNKQRNCPYCRKEYNRDETQKEFQKLIERNGNKNLTGIDLVKAIYQSKTSSQAVIQNIE